ncbi:DNA methyltransferase [Planctomycetota bacterium]
MGKKKASRKGRAGRHPRSGSCGRRDLFSGTVDREREAKYQEPVKCLGMAFGNDQDRREHFLGRLREKLKEPGFRRIDGFPMGEDDEILRLSDPPFYTACPNPFIEDFISFHGRPYDPASSYSREPFASDVSEGKNDPIYSAHSYHTKVPHKAVMKYILHYTEPGEVVLDAFCGTGMTGVAAQLCGDRAAVEALGYRVLEDGTIIGEDGQPFSTLGARHAVLYDLSPLATFIAYNYTTPVDVDLFEHEAALILDEVEREFGWMYRTLHQDGGTRGKVNYTVWSDVFACPECTHEFVFWDVAVDREKGTVLEEFSCPNCRALLTKRKSERISATKFDKAAGKTIKQGKRVPVLINYSVGKRRYEKAPDHDDLEQLATIEASEQPYWLPTDPMMHVPPGEVWGDEWRPGRAFQYVHELLFRRSALVASSFLRHLRDAPPRVASALLLCLTGVLQNLSCMYRWRANAKGGTVSGTFYMPSTPQEMNAVDQLKAKARAIGSALRQTHANGALVSCQSAHVLQQPDSTADYAFLDPPFGSNLAYSELNFLWESWLRVFTDNGPEAIENKTQGKGQGEYRRLMTACFGEVFRVLKPGRWITVEFSNTKARVWNSIQTALQEVGFVVANVSALDKRQGSFKAVTTPTAVRQDLIISAYKPDGGLEERFARETTSEAGVWDFVRSHLRHLPVFKSKEGRLELIPERDPRILFDQMVSWYVRHGVPVPMSSQEFQQGLLARFAHRDGMLFLSDQAAEYDKKRIAVREALQLELFVKDEATALQWLRRELMQKPQTFQEINTQFMKEIGGWQKHEKPLELKELLDESSLCYDGEGLVPSQIHSYLSHSYRDCRNLEKDDPVLRDRAKNRWYVPDPGKAQDLEKLRDRALLREFWGYLPPGYTPTKSESPGTHLPGMELKPGPIPKGKRIKVIRMEAVRAGFKHCWQNRDYRTIIAVARRIRDSVLQEDPKLLMWYDQAVTRLGDEG